MKQRDVIARKRIQSGLNLHIQLLAGIYLKVFDAPAWGWAIFWTLGVLLLIGSITLMANQRCRVPQFVDYGDDDQEDDDE